MTEIIGYYSNYACEMGSPYTFGASTKHEACDPVLTDIQDGAIVTRIISPPINPAEIECALESWPGFVEFNLLQSGHYARGKDGRIRSAYLTDHQKGAYSAPLIAGTTEDIKVGSEYAYCSKSDLTMALNGMPLGLRCYEGLSSYVRIEETGHPPIYVVDNHHFAYFAWEEARAMGYLQDSALLVHIDRHDDAFFPQTFSAPEDLYQAADYVITQLHVANFILPAVAKGLVDQFWYFHSSPPGARTCGADLGLEGTLFGWTEEVRRNYVDEPIFNRNENSNPIEQSLRQVLASSQNIILDIDLDAFVWREYSNDQLPTEADFSEVVRFISEIAKKARVITIATSPGWADQSVAIPLARQMVRAIVSPVSYPLIQK